MGSQDQLERALVAGVRQEIVVAAAFSEYEFQEELRQWVIGKYSELEGRVEVRWNTWKGVYVTHPDDYPAWSKKEFALIWSALKCHEHVLDLDISVDAGSAG